MDVFQVIIVFLVFMLGICVVLYFIGRQKKIDEQKIIEQIKEQKKKTIKKKYMGNKNPFIKKV